MEKMVAVTVFANGRKIQLFVKGTKHPDGRTTVDTSVIAFCLRALGCEHRGETHSIN